MKKGFISGVDWPRETYWHANHQDHWLISSCLFVCDGLWSRQTNNGNGIAVEHRHLVICFHFSESVIIITIRNFHNKITNREDGIHISIIHHICTRKTKMTIDKRPFEDVSPTNNVWFRRGVSSSISGTSHCNHSWGMTTSNMPTKKENLGGWSHE